MDETITTLQEQINTLDTQTSSNLALFALVGVVIFVLLAVVIIQNRKIQDMQKPRYGFLGKPLYGFMLFAILVGGAGLAIYTQQAPTTPNDVSADIDASVTINYILLNASTKEYRFNAVPYIKDNAWGEDNEKFDIYWTISNTSSSTDIESNISENNPGGITKRLTSGVNKIKATIFFNDKSVEKTIDIIVD